MILPLAQGSARLAAHRGPLRNCPLTDRAFAGKLRLSVAVPGSKTTGTCTLFHPFLLKRSAKSLGRPLFADRARDAIGVARNAVGSTARGISTGADAKCAQPSSANRFLPPPFSPRPSRCRVVSCPTLSAPVWAPQQAASRLQPSTAMSGRACSSAQPVGHSATICGSAADLVRAGRLGRLRHHSNLSGHRGAQPPVALFVLHQNGGPAPLKGDDCPCSRSF